MTKEELKKEAIQYAVDYPTSYGKGYKHKDLRIAYLAGLKAKEPKWHKVADGDLPKNNVEVLVLLENKRMKISIFMKNQFTIWNKDYDTYTKLYNVIAWCEIPKYEE